MVVKIDFVNGDFETVEVEPINNGRTTFEYETESACFIVFGLYETILYPKDFVKSIREIRV